MLQKARGHQIIAIVAPAGYGKTTLLEQWAGRQPHGVAWVSVTPAHEDPVALFTALAAPLERQGVLESTVLGSIASPGTAGHLLAGRMLTGVLDPTRPVRLVVDDLHLLHNQMTLDALGELIAHLPPAWQLAIAGRDAIALPLARWRARGSLLEIGPDALALDDREIAALARRLGVTVSAGEVQELAESSNGWPAVVYLAILASGRAGPARGSLVSGRQPTIADYLRSELLGRSSDHEVAFLTRTSILDRLTGPLCDEVLQQSGSERILEQLARSTLLVEDRAGTYRYHSLLREFLHHELERGGDDIAALHRRAAVWHQRNAQVETAVDHAFAARDLDLAASLVGSVFAIYRWSGRRETTRAWLRRFGEDALRERPLLAVLGAVEEGGIGNLRDAERLADLADRAAFEGHPVDGTASFESSRAMLRAIMCRAGVADMLSHASLAVDLEGRRSAWSGVATWLLANARLLRGELEAADALLADAAALLAASGIDGLGQAAVGQRAMLAIDRGDWAAGERLADDAERILDASHLDGYQLSVITRAAQARVALHRGQVGAATAILDHAVQLRPQLTATHPWLNVWGLLGLARVHLAVDDPSGARTLLAQAQDIRRLRPDLGILWDVWAAVRAEVDRRPAGLVGATSLTAAELRVLQYLPLYLSFKEIGTRLSVKASTVQTHAVAIYGKLGASSRSEAVDLAIEAHLLEAPPHWQAPSHHAWDAERRPR